MYAETENGGKIVAVWGAPGSGKTCLSVKLAQELTEQGHSALLLLADRVTPMLPCLCAPEELSNKRSLGGVLAAPIVTPALLRFNLIRYTGDENLAILGLLKGENAVDYPRPAEAQATGMLDALRQLAEYTVIDCGRDLATDALTRQAIIQADMSLCLFSREMKSVSYLAAHNPLLYETVGCRYSVLSNVRENSCRIKAAVFDEADFVLHYCRELYELTAQGELLQPLQSKASRNYLRELARITDEILQMEGTKK